jgi:hypothetical protein
MIDPNNPYSLLDPQQQGSGGSYAPLSGTLGMTQAAAPQSFTWAQGGAQIPADQLALRHRLALQNSQADYSPIASPWQGLARVAQNINGALDERQLEKQDAKQQGSSGAVIAALAGADPTSVNPNLVAAALANPDNQVQAFAKDVYDKAHPKAPQPNEFQQYLIASGVQPGSQQWIDQNAKRAQASYDPIVNVTLPTGVFAGPRSMLPSSGGAPASGGAETTKKLPDGRTAYFVNGDWYDNPEGK